MKWTEEAEDAIRKVPFFVRKKVRKRVEKEAAGAGKTQVTLAGVKNTQARHRPRVWRRRYPAVVKVDDGFYFDVRATHGRAGHDGEDLCARGQRPPETGALFLGELHGSEQQLAVRSEEADEHRVEILLRPLAFDEVDEVGGTAEERDW